MKGFKEVFRFTLKQQFTIKSARILTIVVALILFFTPLLVITIAELSSEPEPPEIELPGIDEEQIIPDDYSSDGVKSVFYAVKTDDGFSWDVLSSKKLPGYESAEFIRCTNADEAASRAGETNGSLILLLNRSDNRYQITTVMPKDSAFSEDKAAFLTSAMTASLHELLISQMGLTKAQTAAIETEIIPEISEEGSESLLTEEDRANGEMKEIIGMLLPYVNIMLIYFLVLYYGQSVANSVILEKTSKLMDTFLVSVKPRAMIFGKVAASWVAALVQFLIWVLSCVGGFAAGVFIVRTVRPDIDSGFFRLLDLLKNASKIFSLPEIIVSVLLIAGGFFLYCSMAGIAGSFASKPEELSSTIGFFTLTLVISMLITLSAGFIDGEMSVGAKWYDFVPFTATLLTPSRVLLGFANLWTGLASLAITLLLSLGFILFAGKAYTMMSLYKGNVPKPAEIIRMLKE